MAVYTEISADALSTLLADYLLGEVHSLKGIADGVQNSNYMLETDTGRYILTLYESEVASEDLPFFLALMHHLSQCGIACPTPIMRKDGGFISEACARPATLVNFLEGLSVRIPRNEQIHALGIAIAQLHLAAADFDQTRVNILGQPYWRAAFERLASRADEVANGLAQELDTALSIIGKAWVDDLPQGIIHADLFPDNVFFMGNQISGLIDFYFACHDSYAYDLAIILNAWCFESDMSFNVTRAQRLIDGYQSVRSLSDVEISALPILASGAALRFCLSRLQSRFAQQNSALGAHKDPIDYLRRLRFHLAIERPEQYGLNL